MQAKRYLVMIGHGLAARYLLEAMQPCNGWRITVIGDESVGHYNRIQLSPLLAGELSEQALFQRDADVRPRHPVEYRYGVAAVSIDAGHRQVVLADGERIAYDALVLATGARPALPAIGEIDTGNIFSFRTLADTHALQSLPAACPVIVVGGGLLGIEAATGLAGRGHPVRLLHRQPVLMNQQLDATASALLAEALTARGIQLHLDASPRVLATRNRQVSGVVLQDGSYLPTTAVVCATGINPNTGLAATAGCAIGRGVIVDERLETSVAGIYALGECCEFQGQTYGLVAPIREQATVLAQHLSGHPAHYADMPFVTRLKVSGLQVHSLGEQAADGDSMFRLDRRLGEYRRLWLRNDRLVGALLVGDVSDSDWYLQMLRDATDINPIRTQLLFGRPWCEQAA